MTVAPSQSSLRSRLRSVIEDEKTAGLLLLLATVAALLWANLDTESYEALRNLRIGPSALGLDLSLEQWAADGLLAIFFFVVGLELKQELIVGSLRQPRAAVLPMAAAAGGVVVPAAIYLAINLTSAGGATDGWAVPTATDVAFAVSILAVVGSRLPAPLRAFLLTLAVVDDLIAIVIIAVGYTASISVLALVATLVPLAIFGILVQRGVAAWWLLLPLGLLTWALLHASGIHATFAGVALALTVPVNPGGRRRPGTRGLSGAFSIRLGPWSSLVAVPVFAFFAAGVALGGWAGLGEAYSDPVTIGIIVALVLGKPIGILGTTFLVSRLPGMSLGPALIWRDLLGIGVLAGIGFTVSLLIGELAFGPGSARDEFVKVGVLTGSLIAAVAGAAYLSLRNRHYRRAVPADF